MMRTESDVNAESTIPAEGALSRRHIPALDGIRGIAVLMVLLLHFSTFLEPPPGSFAADVRAVFQTGWAGVDLFFALSGFLITGILVDAKGDDGYFRTFYARRVLRIFPLYYAVLAFYFVIAPRLLGAEYAIPFWQEEYYLAFLGNFQPGARGGELVGILWSLGIEEQFYLFWPLLIHLCTRRQAVKACVAFVIGAFLYRLVELNAGASGWLVYHFTPGRIDGLALGALTAITVRDPRGLAYLKRLSGPVAICAAVVLAALTVRERGLASADAVREHMTIGFTVVAVLCSATIAYLVTVSTPTMAARLSMWRPLRSMGKYSYAMYVLHTTVLRVATRIHLMPSRARFLAHPAVWIIAFPSAMVAATFGTGVVTWNVFERHFLRLKRYFEYPPRRVAGETAHEYHSPGRPCDRATSPSDSPLPD